MPASRSWLFADRKFTVKTLLEHAENPKVHETINGIPIQTQPAGLKGCDVLIEFTTPEATLEHLKACVQFKVKMVIGTTGFTPAQVRQIKKASRKIPIVFSSNMSVGVNIVFKLASWPPKRRSKATRSK